MFVTPTPNGVTIPIPVTTTLLDCFSGGALKSKSTIGKKVKKTIKTGKFEIVGESKKIVELKDLIVKISPTNAKVLILGPNGAGKELVARQIHLNSLRNDGPFVEVNCAAIPSELIESELFGHLKGLLHLLTKIEQESSKQQITALYSLMKLET